MVCNREEMYLHLTDNMKQALGCSDPCVIAYCASLARENLKSNIVERVEVQCSCGLIKNASKVSIPNANGSGVAYSAALGVFLDSNKQLKLFEDITDDIVDSAKQLIDNVRVVTAEDKQKLYIKVIVYGDDSRASCTIEKEYLGVREITSDDEVVYQSKGEDSFSKEMNCTLSDIWDYADTCPVEHLEIMKDAIYYNERLIGANSSEIPSSYYNDSEWMGKVISAIQARMEGVNHPVIMNCGSGNQGIFSTISVSLNAKSKGIDEETMLRACLLSNLTVIYIKKKFGSMSALCSGAVSACGVSAGLVYLEERNRMKSLYAIQNVLASAGGIICDGAKVSCALKLQTFLQAAQSSAQIAMHANDEYCLGGFIDEDVEKTVESFARLGKESLVFDRYMCDIVM